MKLEQSRWTKSKQWESHETTANAPAQLVLAFGEGELLKAPSLIPGILQRYPKALILGCSTAGEIHGTKVYDDSVVITAFNFENTPLQTAHVQLADFANSHHAGQALARKLKHDGLTHVLIFSVGLNVNGSELVKGLREALPPKVTMTGGLAGDQARFQETLVISNSGVSSDSVLAVGLYGPNIKVTSSSLGGWDSFGPERVITQSAGNVLHQLDHKNALDIYKTYLGSHAKDLPGSALLFPLTLKQSDSTENLVRTVLAVDHEAHTMTFAGDVPEGSRCQFMKANFDRLIDGAIGAAERSHGGAPNKQPQFALLISCVGRKLVLRQRIEEEVEGVRRVFGEQTVMAGFYSYGEISSFTPNAKCELHNQTMTITTISEDDGKKVA